VIITTNETMARNAQRTGGTEQSNRFRSSNLIRNLLHERPPPPHAWCEKQTVVNSTSGPQSARTLSLRTLPESTLGTHATFAFCHLLALLRVGYRRCHGWSEGILIKV